MLGGLCYVKVGGVAKAGCQSVFRSVFVNKEKTWDVFLFHNYERFSNVVSCKIPKKA